MPSRLHFRRANRGWLHGKPRQPQLTSGLHKFGSPIIPAQTEETVDSIVPSDDEYDQPVTYPAYYVADPWPWTHSRWAIFTRRLLAWGIIIMPVVAIIASLTNGSLHLSLGVMAPFVPIALVWLRVVRVLMK